MHFSCLYLRLLYTGSLQNVGQCNVRDVAGRAPHYCTGAACLLLSQHLPEFSTRQVRCLLLHTGPSPLQVLPETTLCISSLFTCCQTGCRKQGLFSRCSLPQSTKVLIDPSLFPRGQEKARYFLMITLRLVSKTSPLGCSWFKLITHLLITYW